MFWLKRLRNPHLLTPDKFAAYQLELSIIQHTLQELDRVKRLKWLQRVKSDDHSPEKFALFQLQMVKIQDDLVQRASFKIDSMVRNH
jgi:hypothetical protein